MVNERDLFRQFMPGWWDTVRDRAWRKACVDVEVGMRQVIVGGLVIVGVWLLNFVLRGAEAARSDVLPSLLTAAVVAMIFMIWWVICIFVVAKESHQESQEKIAELEAALATTTRDLTVPLIGVSGHGAVGDLSVAVDSEVLRVSGQAPTVNTAPPLQDQLIMLRVDGVKIRNERIVGDAEITPWLQRVRSWEQQAKGVLKQLHAAGVISLADCARFEVLDKGIPPSKWAHATSSTHNNHLRYLSRRIDILLEIMAKL